MEQTETLSLRIVVKYTMESLMAIASALPKVKPGFCGVGQEVVGNDKGHTAIVPP